MSLRLKTYLLEGFALIATVVAIFVVSQTVFTPELDRIEQAEIRREMLRAQNAMNQDLAELGAAVRRYSSSDQAAAFVEGDNDSYAERNLGYSFFLALRADVAAFVRTDGTVLWEDAIDPEADRVVSVPVAFSHQLVADSPLVEHEDADSHLSGIIVLGGRPMLVDSQPVLTSKGNGPVVGALVVGRWLDSSLLAELGNQTLLTLEVDQLSDAEIPSDAESATSLSLAHHPVAVTRGDPETMTGRLVLQDVFGAPAVLLRVTMPAVVSDDVANTWWYFALGLLGVGVIFGTVFVAVLEGSLFRRVGRLTQELRRARSKGGKVASITIDGNDELTLFAEAINDAFQYAERLRSEQEKQAGNLVETLEELQVRHRDLEKAHRHLQQLQQASASLGGTLEIREALKQLEDIALDIFQADEVWLLRLGDDQHLEGLRAFSRFTSAVWLPRLFGCENQDAWLPAETNRLLGTVLGGSSLFIGSLRGMDAAEAHALFAGPPPDLGDFSSLAVVALLADQQAVGLAISASTKPVEFSSDRKSMILLFASQIAQALKNARLYEEIKALGEIDSLTGLYNRRKSLEQLEIEIDRASRYQSTFSILIADIDNFKLFNDTYGHPAGDVIIKRVAGVLKHGTRSSDFVGRYGGDEFILILPETYRATAGSTADHLRTALGALPYVAPDGAPIPLRMSFGAASFPEDGVDAASLVAMADSNLYESKRWGGDTVTIEREEFYKEPTGFTGFNTLDALVSAVDNKDHYTRRHSAQVAEHALAIARALGLDEGTRGKLQVAALLHDVGKIALPDRILRKPGSLTYEEAEAVKHHSLMGGMMISQHLPGLHEVREAVASHHERWDGGGYPAGLAGPDIPLLGRILAVADVYSAMTTDRPYRAALTAETAVGELQRGAGSQLDPQMVRAFVSCLLQGFKASSTRGRAADGGMLGQTVHRAGDAPMTIIS